MHWFCGVVVALSGMASGILVVSANAWMQHPVGFRLVGGQPADVDEILEGRRIAAIGEADHIVHALAGGAVLV